MAHARLAVDRQAAADLLRTPGTLESALDHPPYLGRYARVVLAGLFALQGKLVRLPGPVATLAPVALQLAPYRGFVAIHQPGDGALPMPRFVKNGNSGSVRSE